MAALGTRADPALDRFARLTKRRLGVPIALVSLVDEHRQLVPGQDGLPVALAEQRELPVTQSFCQYLVRSGGALVIEDTRRDPLVCALPSVLSGTVLAYAGMPLVDAAGVIVGTLCVLNPQPRVFTPEELTDLRELAEACSHELQQRLLALTTEAALVRATLSSEIARAVGTTLESGEALGRLTRLVVPSLADWCTAGLQDTTGRIASVLSRHSDPERADDLERFAAAQAADGDPTAIHALVLRSGEALTVGREDAVRLLPGIDPARIDELDVGAAVVVPLRARSGTLGYLTLGRGRSGPCFDAAEVRGALDVGRSTGLALDNAEMFAQQRQNAESLQRHLLTALPQPDHLHLVARYLPASESAQIGGDWYDAFLQPDGATLLVVGDVMGHDMAAAAMMGQLRNLVRGIAYDREDSPAQLLRRVDRTLRGLQVDTLATIVVARIERAGGSQTRGQRRLRWSSAGHPPLGYVLPDGEATLLETPGELLMGIDPDTTRTDQELMLEPESTLLLYTDGLIERRDSPLEHEFTRLRQALSGLAAETPDVLCDELLQRMLPAGSSDDVALLAVRAHDERRPRPAQAGASQFPVDRPST